METYLVLVIGGMGDQRESKHLRIFKQNRRTIKQSSLWDPCVIHVGFKSVQCGISGDPRGSTGIQRGSMGIHGGSMDIHRFNLDRQANLQGKDPKGIHWASMGFPFRIRG